MSLQCEPSQRWRGENEEDGEGGRGLVLVLLVVLLVVVGMRRGGVAEPRELLKAARPLALPCAPAARPWPGCNPSGSLAGLHAQLLPVGRLLGLRLGAGVGASVERRHGAAFGIGVQAAVRRGVAGLELGGALHLLQSTDLLLQQRVLPLQVVDILLVCVVFSPHVLDVFCGFV